MPLKHLILCALSAEHSVYIVSRPSVCPHVSVLQTEFRWLWVKNPLMFIEPLGYSTFLGNETSQNGRNFKRYYFVILTKNSLSQLSAVYATGQKEHVSIIKIRVQEICRLNVHIFFNVLSEQTNAAAEE